MIKLIEVCEGELHDIHEFPTQELCDAFSDGFSAGANNYGAGSAYTLTLEGIEEALANLSDFHDEDMLNDAKAQLEK